MIVLALSTVKLTVALLAAVLLGFSAWLRRTGRPTRYRRLLDLLLVGLTLAAALSWFNLLRPAQRFIHVPDVYHYFIGAKYFDELAYTRLYECTALADHLDTPGSGVAVRRIRDLKTNRFVTPADVLADPARCTAHFTTQRWDAFRLDVAWFRARIPTTTWRAMQRDHGYNATPVWGILGTSLSGLGRASDGWILALTLLDPLMLALMFGVIAWAFGWRSMCIALIFFGTNPLGAFEWVGGGFLRQDWLAATLIGVSLIRKERPLSGGFLLTYATLLRVFPGALLLAIALKTIVGAWRTKSLRASRPTRELILGCSIALVLLVPLSMFTAGGPRAWLEFGKNSHTLMTTPALNSVGLSAVLWYQHDTRYAELWDAEINDTLTWKAARLDTLKQRRLWVWLTMVAFAVLLTLTVAREEDSSAALLGVGAIPLLFVLSGYYYAILLAYGLLHRRLSLVGPALCLLSATLGAILLGWRMTDEIHTWSSVAVLVFVFGITLLAYVDRPTRTAQVPTAAADSG